MFQMKSAYDNWGKIRHPVQPPCTWYKVMEVINKDGQSNYKEYCSRNLRNLFHSPPSVYDGTRLLYAVVRYQLLHALEKIYLDMQLTNVKTNLERILMTDKYPIPYSKESVYFQYDVKDFNRARKFYEEILGFEKIWDGGEEVGWMEFALPITGARLGLNYKPEGEIARGSGTLTLVVDDLVVPKEYLKTQFGMKRSEYGTEGLC